MTNKGDRRGAGSGGGEVPDPCQRSQLADTNQWLSALIARPMTGAWWPRRTATAVIPGAARVGPTGGRRGRRCRWRASGRRGDRQGADRAVMTGEDRRSRPPRRAARGRRRCPRCRHQPAVVAGEGDRRDATLGPTRTTGPAGGPAPARRQSRASLSALRRQPAAVRTEGNGGDLVPGAGERQRRRLRRRPPPQPDLVVFATARQQFAIGAPGQGDDRVAVAAQLARGGRRRHRRCQRRR